MLVWFFDGQERYAQLRCDVPGCGKQGPPARTPGEAAFAAESASWFVVDTAATCDTCTEAGALPEEPWDDVSILAWPCFNPRPTPRPGATSWSVSGLSLV
jgi:hypothetical protein